MPPNRMLIRNVIPLAILSVSALPAGAQETLSYKNWDLTGFLTLGYTQTDKYDDRVIRRNVSQDGQQLKDNGFLIDSRIGLQLQGELNDHWELVFQGVYREQYASELMDYIDVAFARYQASNEWKFTLGRQPFDVFILSDHRSVGYSYDWVRPPTEFYGFIPFDSIDGAKVSRDWGDFDNAWSWSLSVGFAKEQFENDALEEDDLDDEPDEPDDEDITKVRPIYNTALSWRSGPWYLRGNFAYLEYEQELDEARDFLEFEQQLGFLWPDFSNIRRDFTVSNKLRYFAVGGSWESGDWKLQSEISRIDSDFVYYYGTRAYFHVGRRFGEFLPYMTLGYAQDSSSRSYRVPQFDDEQLAGLQELFAEIVEDIDEEVTSVRQNQTSIGIGLRWDFSRRKAAKFQCDRFYFEAGSGSIHGRLDQTYSQDETRTWCSATFDWVF